MHTEKSVHVASLSERFAISVTKATATVHLSFRPGYRQGDRAVLDGSQSHSIDEAEQI